MGKEAASLGNEAGRGELWGGAGYDGVAVRGKAHLAAVKAARGVGSRKVLPLLVHPATLAASTHGGRAR